MTKYKHIIFSVLAFLITMVICLIIIVPAVNSTIESDKAHLELMISDASAHISEAITTPINQIHTIAAYIQNTDGDFTNFNRFAQTVVGSNYVRNLIIAPGGVVSQVYPDNIYNHSVLGLDYYSDSSQGNREAASAAETRSLVLAGPFTTVAGDEAISGRLPIYLPDQYGKKQYWGLVSITLHYPSVLDDCNLQELGDMGYSYQLWRTNVDTGERQTILSGGPTYRPDCYMEQTVEIYNAQWHLSMAPLHQWYEYRETWIYLATALLISLMMALLVWKISALRNAKVELEDMVHRNALTGLPNRKGLYTQLETLHQNKEPFLLSFLDLNFFKSVNDRYGHAAGDLALAQFAHRVEQVLFKDHIFAHISGDEFVLVFTGSCASQEYDAQWDAIYTQLAQPLVFDGNDIFITFSKGTAAYPQERDSIDGVMMLADERMYQDKKAQIDAQS